MAESKVKKNYYDLGVLCKSQKGGFYIKLNKDIELTVNGKNYKGEKFEVTLEGESYLNLNTPQEKYTRMFKGDSEKIQERLEKTPEYVRQYVTASVEVKDN